jgi:hypothetical protein
VQTQLIRQVQVVERLVLVRHQYRVNKDLVQMDKEMLSKLSSLVNHKQWQHLNNYLEYLVEIQQKALEQSDNEILVYRAQGAIAVLRRLSNLRDDVRNSNG